MINFKKTTDPLDESHDIVNINDEVIGVAQRKEFLKNRKLMRRSAHIWLENSKGQWWLQQRSKTKDLQPLHWECAAAGFVKADKRTKKEILIEATRELKEELGIKAQLKLFKIIPMPHLSVGGIMVYWYMGKSNGPFKLSQPEIKDFKAFDLKKV